MSNLREATPIILTADERAELEGLTRSTKTEHRTRLKAQIVLMAAEGAATRAIARAVGCTIGTASKWRVRYAKDRLAGFSEVGARGAEAKYDEISSGVRVDLIRPQAELAQHHEDGIVPPPQRCRSITTIEDFLNLRGRQIGRQAGELPSPDGGHAADQRERVQPCMMEVSEKCAQRPAHRFPGRRPPIPGVALDVTGDVLLSDLAEVAGAGGAFLAHEPADGRQMADDGLRHQPAFPSQIIAELLEYLLLRGDGRQCRRRDLPASRSTDSNRFNAARSPGWMDCFPALRWRYPLDHAFIEITQLRAALCDPAQESADQAEAPPSALASEPVFDKTRRVEFDGLSVESVLQAPE